MRVNQVVRIWIAIAAVVVAVWSAWAFLLAKSFFKYAADFGDKGELAWGMAERGQWGDSFGGLTALFSALGFSAIILTLYFQYQQIQHEQKESESQRLALIEASKDRNKEQFEASFLNCLSCFVKFAERCAFGIRPSI
ncbi:hypothetical protein [Hansschlegelia plantiphila]|uniref:Uncharacterized protein n=1 Tax=Hansschlegelia plantiphila TaxID=374655 RepID=A0A9W6MU29_9HYPH|nr:hypothetical protein [Hansschlegelia plantiphila]GLK66386.1 hypothetical protein GCM10008179_00240 [Hansschlegelia plantiphila]